ncbi:membrane-spanning 4-domains subfamily A member 4A-like isoform X2 [Hoplias malabaricus]|uniref:membrane-spanning 4-domains subfamily A member 4A-like isoform X2 n=1 Tax=Hoplias malabaricus TaxID=27720 RepID=UPI0034631023
MSNPAVLLTNTGPGYTIVTHVISPESATAQTGQNPPSNNPLQRFLKGEPKALGTFQIMTGLITILMGIVLAANTNSLIVFSGIAFWGSLLYITAGALAVSASNKLTKCQVVGSLVMNVFSAITAGISIILLSLDFVIWGYRGCRYRSSYYEHYYNCSSELTDGILGVLLVFTIVQFIVSICLSAFACKSCCCSKPMSYAAQQFELKMATSEVPAEVSENGFTILTHVIPPLSPPSGESPKESETGARQCRSWWGY